MLDLGAPKTASPDVIKAMSLDMFFDLLAVRLIGPQAAGKKLVFNASFTDTGEQYLLVVENCVLNYASGKQSAEADATLVMTRAALNEIVLGEATLAEKTAIGEARIEGDPAKLVEFLSLLDSFEFWFNIVTP